LAPMQPYAGLGELPEAQQSTQSLANVTKALQHPGLLKEVSTTLIVLPACGLHHSLADCVQECQLVWTCTPFPALTYASGYVQRKRLAYLQECQMPS
jgi:hypothetical protein